MYTVHVGTYCHQREREAIAEPFSDDEGKTLPDCLPPLSHDTNRLLLLSASLHSSL